MGDLQHKATCAAQSESSTDAIKKSRIEFLFKISFKNHLSGLNPERNMNQTKQNE